MVPSTSSAMRLLLSYWHTEGYLGIYEYCVTQTVLCKGPSTVATCHNYFIRCLDSPTESKTESIPRPVIHYLVMVISHNVETLNTRRHSQQRHTMRPHRYPQLNEL